MTDQDNENAVPAAAAQDDSPAPQDAETGAAVEHAAAPAEAAPEAADGAPLDAGPAPQEAAADLHAAEPEPLDETDADAPIDEPDDETGEEPVAGIPAATRKSGAATPPASAGERIAKVMSRAGVASRREAERMIVEGRVTVNGKVIASPALDVAAADRIAVDGKQIEAPQETRLWLYYKPIGIVTTDSDEKGRQTIQDALPRDLPRVMTVGRLDLNSEGLLLLTNDGTLKRMLELPSTGWLRRYRVRVNGTPNDLTLAPLKRGITIDGEEFAPMEVTIDSSRGANSWLTIGIREGRNREIRRAMAFVNLTVNRLIRIGYGPFKLADMEKNEVREVKRRLLREQLGGLMPGAPEAEARTPAEAPRKPRAPRRDDDARPGAPRPARAFGSDRRSAPGDDAKPRMRRDEGGDRPARGPRPAADTRPDRPARKPWGAEGGERPARAPRPTGDARPERPARKPWSAGPAGATGYQRRRPDDAGADRPPRGPRPAGDARPDRPARKPWDAGAGRAASDKPGHQRRSPPEDGATGRPDRAPRPGGYGGADRAGARSWGEGDRKPAGERTGYQGRNPRPAAANGPRGAADAAAERPDRPARKSWGAGGSAQPGGKGGYAGRSGATQPRPAGPGGNPSRPRSGGDAAKPRGGPGRDKPAWGAGGGRPPSGGKPRPPTAGGGKPPRGPSGKPPRDR